MNLNPTERLKFKKVNKKKTKRPQKIFIFTVLESSGVKKTFLKCENLHRNQRSCLIGCVMPMENSQRMVFVKTKTIELQTTAEKPAGKTSLPVAKTKNFVLKKAFNW